jgi:hypothetical protein
MRKFGENTAIDIATAPEDIWDGGGLWVPPTQARIHTLSSDSSADTMVVRIWGLRTWDEHESFEDVVLEGLSGVETVNSYVIVHRMRCLTGLNVGNISAVANTDATTTAYIEANEGTSHMVIYGVGRPQTAIMVRAWFGLNRDSGASSWAEGVFLSNTIPDIDLDAWIESGHRSAKSTGTSALEIPAEPAIVFPGPAIIKFQCSAVSNNSTRVQAGFAGFLMDK